jgi:hypothetical protein
MTFYDLLNRLHPLTYIRIIYPRHLELNDAFKLEVYRVIELLELDERGLLGDKVINSKVSSIINTRPKNKVIMEVYLNA